MICQSSWTAIRQICLMTSSHIGQSRTSHRQRCALSSNRHGTYLADYQDGRRTITSMRKEVKYERITIIRHHV